MKIILTYSTPNEYNLSLYDVDTILLTERIKHVAVQSVVVFSAPTETISSVIVTIEAMVDDETKQNKKQTKSALNAASKYMLNFC